MPSKSVLIVEDSTEIGRLLQAALSTLPAELQVKLVPSAEDAILSMARQVYDLLIVDVHLPGISGLELTRKLRARKKDVRVIQISGLSQPDLPDQALQKGADVFFSKPLAMGEFLEAVTRLLNLQPASPPARGAAQPPDAAALLAQLRGRVGGEGALLLNRAGKILASSLPEGASAQPFGAGLLPAVQQAALGLRDLGAALGQATPAGVLAIPGPQSDVLVAPVGKERVLALALPRGRTTLRLAVAVEEVLETLVDLLPYAEVEFPEAAGGVEQPGDRLEVAADLPDISSAPTAVLSTASPAPGLPADSPGQPEPQEPAAAEPEPEDLVTLLEDPAAASPEEASRYWEQVSEQAPNPAHPDGRYISYEKARQMGLAPGAEAADAAEG